MNNKTLICTSHNCSLHPASVVAKTFPWGLWQDEKNRKWQRHPPLSTQRYCCLNYYMSKHNGMNWSEFCCSWKYPLFFAETLVVAAKELNPLEFLELLPDDGTAHFFLPQLLECSQWNLMTLPFILDNLWINTKPLDLQSGFLVISIHCYSDLWLLWTWSDCNYMLPSFIKPGILQLCFKKKKTSTPNLSHNKYRLHNITKYIDVQLLNYKCFFKIVC